MSVERQNVVACVVGLGPTEPFVGVVLRIQCGQFLVQAVQGADQGIDAAVVFAFPAFHVIPVNRAGLGPFLYLTKLLALEEQVLAGVRPHIGE